MKEYKFKKIDAFATEKSSGNPAGYILLDKLEDISEHDMLQIAKELKGFVNEVGYVAKVRESEFDLRYYSSEREVDFCGHATIAILYDLIKTDDSVSSIPTLTINTNKGTLKVENRFKESDSVFIMSPNQEPKETSINVEELANKLGVDKENINSDYPISIINAGLSTLIVPITNLESILAISPDLTELKEYCFSKGIDIIEVYTSNVRDKTNDYRTRVLPRLLDILKTLRQVLEIQHLDII
jgi:PhzF family phenazine biosynthesis protein